jgi:Rrf2 family iron-sulfur cluster assembly transcriptional regulator
MFRLSKKMLFAIEAVLDIAYHGTSEPVQSREITRRQKIPQRYLEQALQQLVRAGILIGVRGPRGGYRLARERRRISVGEIVRVVRAVESGDEAMEEDGGSELARTVVRPMWQEFQNDIMNRLDTITIDELCVRADKEGVVSEGRQNLDFAI